MITFGLLLGLSHKRAEQDGLQHLQDLVRKWFSEKEGKPDSERRQFKPSEHVYEVAGAQVWEFNLSEVTEDSGLWFTEVRAYRARGEIRDLKLSVVMRISAEDGQPLRYYVEPPSFVRQLQHEFDVLVGSFGASAAARPVSEADVDWLVGEITSSTRSLPLVVVTDPVRDAAIIPDLPDRLARFAFGMAEVAHVSAKATFKLTEAIGKEMSCFDGGLRIYKVGWSKNDEPFRHPLFLKKRMLVSASHDPQDPDGLIRSWLMSILTRDAIGRFAYPKEMLDVIAESDQRRLRKELADRPHGELAAEVGRLKRELAQQQDLASTALAENTSLVSERESLRHQIEVLRKRLEALQSQESEEVRTTEDELLWAIPATEEALERARVDFAGTLVIPVKVEVDTNLSPGLLYHALLALHKLCEAERRGQAKNKRVLLQQLLVEHAGLSKNTFKVGDTNVYATDPDTGKRIHLRERVHLREGKPAETESIYWSTIGDKQPTYRYLIGRIGTHA